MTTLFDELEGGRKRWMVLAIAALILGAVKVKNELQMTKEYHEQAVEQKLARVALERIANGMRDGLYITNDSRQFLKAWAFEQKRNAPKPSARSVGEKWTEKVDCNTRTCTQASKSTATCSETAMFCGKEAIGE